MHTIRESQTNTDNSSFIQDDFVRVDGGLITEIECIEKFTIAGRGTTVKLKVTKPKDAGPWSWDMGVVATWDEDSCSLVELAKNRGVGLENLDDLEGEELYIVPNTEKNCWSFHPEYPREMFNSDEIENSISIEGRKTLESKSEKVDEDVEMDCMQYETVGDYFVCTIERMEEIERVGACNIIECVVDTPYDTGRWRFEKPYGWKDDNQLVQLAESRGYGKGNFTALVGDEVLVKRDENEWAMSTENPWEVENEHELSVEDKDDSSHGLRGTIYGILVALFMAILFFGAILLML